MSVPLAPVSFLDRAEAVCGDRPGLVDGDAHYTYRQLAERARRLAGALVASGVKPNERVSVLAPNSGLALLAHFGVNMAGAVLNMLNTRLSAAELGYIIAHAGSRLLVVDDDYLVLGSEAAALSGGEVKVLAASQCERLMMDAPPTRVEVTDEFGLISINYTSGTTGSPKGVMYSYRGAYLQALAMVAQAGLGPGSVFLWTLPMFHCNGWCFPWAVTAAGGRHVALRKVEPGEIWAQLRDHGVTHFNAAPTVLAGLVDHPDAAPLSRQVQVAAGGAPPSPALLRSLAELNIEVTHLYGLTETYGPAMICDWLPEWNALSSDQQARLKARQGVGNLVSQPVRVVDPAGHDVPRDGATAGEVVLRGNNVMLGYYRDPEATKAASVAGPGGNWFRTGDVGVMFPDGYVELKDRLKDVIVSGGENIASIEVEQALESHPAVLEAAVVGCPDDHWGEVPVAFVTLASGGSVSEAELIAYVKSRIARFKAPKRVEFCTLPKTGTGKVRKVELRARGRAWPTTGGGSNPGGGGSNPGEGG